MNTIFELYKKVGLPMIVRDRFGNEVFVEKYYQDRFSKKHLFFGWINKENRYRYIKYNNTKRWELI